MCPQQSDRIREIKSFPQLVKYLRDELNWPIESTDFDDLTFDYNAEELGIDHKTAAKIQEIKQLRPLVTGQPWGIFFVKFEPKRLPVVVLRKILGQLAIKKRASSRKADQAAWHLNDLLFISNYGEGVDRQITFAQFAQPENSDEIPVLQVLGWDDADTVLHLEHVNKELKNKLSWPKNESNAAEWRAKWSSAFVMRHMEVVTTSKQLAIRLAELARRIRSRAKQVLSVETERGQFKKLQKAFQEALIHDLTQDDFADMYAQTIAYGLLAARISRPMGIGADDITDIIPNTNPFLKELLESFLKVGGRKGGLDFDELGIQEVVSLLNSPTTHIEAVLRDFGNMNPQEDPVIHFYELFLKEYDAKKRMQRGVFYTPRPIVSYIVRSVDELLRTEYGLEDGLADVTTWGEMAKRNPAITIPEGTPTDQPFVQILDPATGTGTFLVETIEIIHRTLVAKWNKLGHREDAIKCLWNEYVPKHLLTRLHGYELLMAPYAIAHLKIGLKLFETGYRFTTDERARVYLTNSLEPPSDGQYKTAMVPALAHESQAVNDIKRKHRFTVVIGNPPYAVEGINNNDWIDGLMDVYREAVRNEHNIQLLSDDYAKFIRLADHIIGLAGCGLLVMITKNTYLNTTAFRGLRKHLQSAFDQVSVLDLHGKLYGKTPDGTPDTNVFEIRVGVSILLARRIDGKACHQTFDFCELWGIGEWKLELLSKITASTTSWSSVPSDTKQWTLEPLAHGEDDIAAQGEYSEFVPFLQIAVGDESGPGQGRRWGGGVKTNRDFLLVAFSKSELEQRFEVLTSPLKSVNSKKNQLGLEDGAYWNTEREIRKLQSIDWRSRIFPYLYGPFDFRFVAHIPQLIEIGRGGASKHLMRHFQNKRNVALVLKRRNLDPNYHHVYATRFTCDINCLGGQTYIIPLSASDDQNELFNDPDAGKGANANFSGYNSSKVEVSREHFVLFNFVYAILHSPTYRRRYGRELRKEFPRLPRTSSRDLFLALTELGSELVALHLMESPKLNEHISEWTGGKNPEVEKVTYSDQTVWIDKAMTMGFEGVPDEVWNFYIGGYQVCEKWLKDRKGRKLTKGDIEHYQKIIVALSETIRLMAEIDKAIDQHGGWPGAFKT